MMREILMSQLLALIKVSRHTKCVKTQDGDLTWIQEKNVNITQRSHNISFIWDRDGTTRESLHMLLIDKRISAPWLSFDDPSAVEYVLRAFLFTGDNCNKHTRFLYELMADNTNIIDDIGLVGGRYRNKNLLNIDPWQIASDKVNRQNRYAKENAQ